MRMRSGAVAKRVPPRLVIACASRFRGNPSGSQVMNGSFDSPGPSTFPPPQFPEAGPYDLFSLKAFSPAAVIGGTGSGLFVVPGPTQAPDRSRFGAGPGGFGIFGMPSEMNPSGRGRRPAAAGLGTC